MVNWEGESQDERAEGAKRVISQFQHLRTSGSKWFNMITLLLRFQHTQCRDDRDRLFAFVGLASDVRATATHDGNSTAPSPKASPWSSKMIEFSPDYALRTEDVYYNFAVGVLRSAWPYTILQCAGAYATEFAPRDCGKSAGKQPSITKQKSYFTTRRPQLPSWVPDWRQRALRYRPFLGPYPWKPSGSFGLSRGSINIKDEALHLSGASVGTIALTWELPPEDDAFHALSVDRKKCSTDGGMCGTVPLHAQQGDGIFLFAGAKVFFVLRPRSPLGSYTVVGDCCLDDAMEGQLAEQALSHQMSITII